MAQGFEAHPPDKAQSLPTTTAPCCSLSPLVDGVFVMDKL